MQSQTLLAVAVLLALASQHVRAFDVEEDGTCLDDEDGAVMAALAGTALASGVNADDYSNKIVLVVNVASFCGFTISHYNDLNAMVQQYPADKFAVLAFPCNQFGKQEPYPDDQIAEVLFEEHSIRPLFPLQPKVDIKGDTAAPLFRTLHDMCPFRLEGRNMNAKPAEDYAWNFEKFLITPDGKPWRRYQTGVHAAWLRADVDVLMQAFFGDGAAEL